MFQKTRLRMTGERNLSRLVIDKTPITVAGGQRSKGEETSRDSGERIQPTAQAVGKRADEDEPQRGETNLADE